MLPEDAHGLPHMHVVANGIQSEALPGKRNIQLNPRDGTLGLVHPVARHEELQNRVERGGTSHTARAEGGLEP
eukprot:5399984-Alexandrium_andersonii.AAC.1